MIADQLTTGNIVTGTKGIKKVKEKDSNGFNHFKT